MKLRFRSLFVRCSVLHVSPRAPPCVYSTVTQVNYDDKWKEKSYRHKSVTELHSLTIIFDCLKSKQTWNQHLLMHTLYPITPPFIHLWFHQNKVHTHHGKVHVSPKQLELHLESHHQLPACVFLRASISGQRPGLCQTTKTDGRTDTTVRWMVTRHRPIR